MTTVDVLVSRRQKVCSVRIIFPGVAWGRVFNSFIDGCHPCKVTHWIQVLDQIKTGCKRASAPWHELLYKRGNYWWIVEYLPSCHRYTVVSGQTDFLSCWRQNVCSCHKSLDQGQVLPRSWNNYVVSWQTWATAASVPTWQIIKRQRDYATYALTETSSCWAPTWPRLSKHFIRLSKFFALRIIHRQILADWTGLSVYAWQGGNKKCSDELAVGDTLSDQSFLG